MILGLVLFRARVDESQFFTTAEEFASPDLSVAGSPADEGSGSVVLLSRPDRRPEKLPTVKVVQPFVVEERYHCSRRGAPVPSFDQAGAGCADSDKVGNVLATPETLDHQQHCRLACGLA